MTARSAGITKRLKNVYWIITLTLALLLSGLTGGVGLAQQSDWIPQDATEFSTYLQNLNAMAVDQGVRQAAQSSASQVFTTQMDALRAAAFAVEIESGNRIVVQDANEHVTQLQELRQTQPTTFLAATGE